MDAAQREYLRREISRRRKEETRLEQVAKQGPRRKTRDFRPKSPNRHPQAMVPVAPIFAGLFRHAVANGWGDTPNMIFTEISHRTNYTPRTLHRVASQETVSFDVADYIVTCVNVHLWMRDDAMREIYESVDFRWWDPAFVREQRLAYLREYNNERYNNASGRERTRGAKKREERLERMNGKAVPSAAPDGRKNNKGVSAERLTEIAPRRG
jgi:hypothetical protein